MGELQTTAGSWSAQGEIAQSLLLVLENGEQMWASRGAIVSLGDGVRWYLKVPGGMGAAVGRAFAGEGLTLTRIESARAGARVVLGAGQPGKVEAWDLESRATSCARAAPSSRRGATSRSSRRSPSGRAPRSLAARAGVKGCRNMLFGGEGLFMARLTGPGTVLLQSLKRALPRQGGKG